MKVKIVFLSVLVLILSGCFGEEKKNSDPEPAAVDSAAAGRKAGIQKWNSYVDLGNALDADFYRAINSYFDAFGNSAEYRPAAQAGLAGEFQAAMSDPIPLASAIEQALALASQEPKNELDQAVFEVTGHLRDLWGGLNRFRELLTTDSAAGDDQEEARRQLHEKIYEAYQGLAAAYGRFRDTLGQADSERRKEDIQAMRDKGLKLKPAMLKVVDDAQSLQNLLSGRSISSGTLRTIPETELRPLLDELFRSAADFAKVLDQTGKSDREGLKDKPLTDFQAQVRQVMDSAQGLDRRVRHAEPAPANPENIPGTPEHFGQTVGQLVDYYNSALY